MPRPRYTYDEYTDDTHDSQGPSPIEMGPKSPRGGPECILRLLVKRLSDNPQFEPWFVLHDQDDDPLDVAADSAPQVGEMEDVLSAPAARPLRLSILASPTQVVGTGEVPSEIPPNVPIDFKVYIAGVDLRVHVAALKVNPSAPPPSTIVPLAWTPPALAAAARAKALTRLLTLVALGMLFSLSAVLGSLHAEWYMTLVFSGGMAAALLPTFVALICDKMCSCCASYHTPFVWSFAIALMHVHLTCPAWGIGWLAERSAAGVEFYLLIARGVAGLIAYLVMVLSIDPYIVDCMNHIVRGSVHTTSLWFRIPYATIRVIDGARKWSRIRSLNPMKRFRCGWFHLDSCTWDANRLCCRRHPHRYKKGLPIKYEGNVMATRIKQKGRPFCAAGFAGEMLFKFVTFPVWIFSVFLTFIAAPLIYFMLCCCLRDHETQRVSFRIIYRITYALFSVALMCGLFVGFVYLIRATVPNCKADPGAKSCVTIYGAIGTVLFVIMVGIIKKMFSISLDEEDEFETFLLLFYTCAMPCIGGGSGDQATGMNMCSCPSCEHCNCDCSCETCNEGCCPGDC